MINDGGATKTVEADGIPYGGRQEAKPGGSMLHDDVKKLKESIANLAAGLATFSVEVPDTAWVQVECDINAGKKITVGASRKLKDGETTDEAHERLYKQCLESLVKLVG